MAKEATGYYVPEAAVWQQQQKSIARCACTEADRLECQNFDVPSTTIDGNEACTCRCHKERTKS